MDERESMKGALNKFYPKGKIKFDQVSVLWDALSNAAGGVS
jgi:hypothetical protein